MFAKDGSVVLVNGVGHLTQVVSNSAQYLCAVGYQELQKKVWMLFVFLFAVLFVWCNSDFKNRLFLVGPERFRVVQMYFTGSFFTAAKLFVSKAVHLHSEHSGFLCWWKKKYQEWINPDVYFDFGTFFLPLMTITMCWQHLGRTTRENIFRCCAPSCCSTRDCRFVVGGKPCQSAIIATDKRTVGWEAHPAVRRYYSVHVQTCMIQVWITVSAFFCPGHTQLYCVNPFCWRASSWLDVPPCTEQSAPVITWKKTMQHCRLSGCEREHHCFRKSHCVRTVWGSWLVGNQDVLVSLWAAEVCWRGLKYLQSDPAPGRVSSATFVLFVLRLRSRRMAVWLASKVFTSFWCSMVWFLRMSIWNYFCIKHKVGHAYEHNRAERSYSCRCRIVDWWQERQFGEKTRQSADRTLAERTCLCKRCISESRSLAFDITSAVRTSAGKQMLCMCAQARTWQSNVLSRPCTVTVSLTLLWVWRLDDACGEENDEQRDDYDEQYEHEEGEHAACDALPRRAPLPPRFQLRIGAAVARRLHR